MCSEVTVDQRAGLGGGLQRSGLREVLGGSVGIRAGQGWIEA